MHKQLTCKSGETIFLFLKRLLVFAMVFQFFGVTLFSQLSDTSPWFDHLHIQHIGVEHGLSQGSIYSIYKDSRGFMWFTSNEGLNRYDGFEVKTYQNSRLDTNSLAGNYTNGIVEDGHGNLWVGSEVCLNRYVRRKNHFEFVFAIDNQGQKTNSTNFPFFADSTEVWYTNSKEGILKYNFLTGEKQIINDSFLYNRTNYMINSTFRTLDGNIWVRLEAGVARLDPESGKVSHYFSRHEQNEIGQPLAVNSFYQNKKGTIWMGIRNRLLKMNPYNLSYEIIDSIENLNTGISDIRQDEKGYLWLGTEQDGLFVFDEERGVLKQFTNAGKPTMRLTNNSPATIYIDNQDIIWTNVDPEGINILKEDFKAFKSYTQDLFHVEDFVSSSVRHFAERPDGKIWIVTEKDGTCLFNPKTEQLEKVLRPEFSDLSDRNESCVFVDSRERIWIGTYNGFYYFQNEGDNIKRLYNQANTRLYSFSNFIWNMLETEDGKLVFSSEAGVYYMEMDELEPKLLYELSNPVIPLYMDEQGRLLFSEFHNGFHVINYEAWVNGEEDKKWNRQFLEEYNVKCFYQNKPYNDYWIGTNNGLLHIFPDENWHRIDSLKRYTHEDGLPSIYIYGILPDENNHLWISTNRGLASFDLETEHFKSYILEDGIQGYEFNTGGYIKATTGEMYFGGTNGFNRFRPDQINKNPVPPLRVQITDFFINGKPKRDGGYIGEMNSIQLPYEENTFTIHYTALDYLSNGQNQYRIFLEGYDKNQQEVSSQRSVRYTRVPEGRYVFYVDACNRDGIWTGQPQKLSIRIKPPWHRSWWAGTSYLLVLGVVLYLIHTFRHRRRVLRLQLELEQKEAERLKEIDNLKNKIYTNITHEFRTPLTVIEGMADEIADSAFNNTRKKAGLIKKNSRRLLHLVNQMLELAKLESYNARSELIQDDIIPFLAYMVDSYSSLAEGKKISLQFYSETPSLTMDFDAEKLRKIMSNLLTNAVKFTPEYGKVLVVARQVEAEILIKVIDSGMGISEAHLSNIFSRFYRADESGTIEGSGIGLAIVKELTDLLGGRVWAESTVGKGTTFFLKLPTRNKAPLIGFEADNILEPFIDITGDEKETKMTSSLFIEEEKPLVLIVEDNADLVYYLRNCLSETYNLLVSRNGEEGIESALEAVPDIVISDVMMPKKDGFELCQTLKSDLRTSHIPIVLLTAKADEESKLMGLEKGADAYLKKPFSKDELLVRINKLIELREKLKARYLSTGLEQKISEIPKTAEDEFILELKRVINLHLADAAFSIAQLCREMAMSRTQIHRKLKALTGTSTSIYIRKLRLSHARQLLTTTDKRVSEIALECGFESFSWFAQAFKDEFGQQPSNLRK